MNTPRVKIINKTSYFVDKYIFTKIFDLLGKYELLLEGKEIGIYLVDNDEIRQLNRKYFGRDSVTNVLTFNSEFTEVPYLGEVVINIESIKQSAGSIWLEELKAVFIHGVLHLLGYDHINTSESKIMAAREEELDQKISMQDIEDE